MNYFDFALKSIFRKKHRTYITIFSISLGFCALCVLGGILNNIFSRLKEQAIVNEKIGHISIAKKGFSKNAKVTPEEYIFQEKELNKLVELIRSIEDVELVSPRLSLVGIMYHNNNSSIFISEAIVPSDDEILNKINIDGRTERINQKIKDNRIAIGSEFAENFKIKVGDELTLLVNTIDGSPNAVDVIVNEIFNTGNPATNDKFILITLSIAQELLGIKGADRIVVTIKKIENINILQKELMKSSENAGFDIELKTWDIISNSYLKVKKMFTIIFRVIIAIISIIVCLMLVNIFQMSISERSFEIASMRAMGLTKQKIEFLFCVEGFIMSLIGCIGAIPILLIIKWILHLLNLTFVPPVASISVPVNIILNMIDLIIVSIIFLFIGIISSLISINIIVQKKINKSLIYNI
jgi:putative ABC transport system permease protein